MDEILKEKEVPSASLIVRLDVKWLRDIKSLILTSGLKPAVEYAEEKSHPRLWKEISSAALLQLNLEVASAAFIRCEDYQGIQFLKRLRKLEDPLKKQAEVAAYCLDFDGAEKKYLDMDRKDLAIDLRIRLGDWFRVVQLIKSGGGGDDALLEKAWNHIGDHYFERQRWAQAITYYLQGRNSEKLAEVYYILEDYESIEKIASGLSENSPQLRVSNFD